RGDQAATSRRSASSGAQHFCKAVDVLRRAPLRDGNEQRVVETFVAAPQRVPGMDAPLACGADRVLRVPSDAHDKLLECCLFGKRELDTRVHESCLRVVAEAHAGLPQLAETLRPEPREID